MITHVNKVLRPRTLPALWDALDQVEGPRYFLAGGTDLLVKAKDGIVPDGTWIDIWGFPGFNRVVEDKDCVRVGALVTMAEVEENPLLAVHAPALAHCARSDQRDPRCHGRVDRRGARHVGAGKGGVKAAGVIRQ